MCVWILCYIYAVMADNPWDRLSVYFDTNKDPTEIESNAADNILLSWPVVLGCIRANVHQSFDSRALDYGCGTGQFASKLSELGFHTIGIDLSKPMIDAAKGAHDEVAEFIAGDADVLPSLGKFTLITSLMTLQFVENVQGLFGNLAPALADDGMLIFSVFNPAYVSNAIRANVEFFDFDSASHPTTGYMELVEDIRVPTYIRSANDYTQLAQQHGLELILEAYPPFTNDFLAAYPHPVPTNDPEYLILAYKKAV